MPLTMNELKILKNRISHLILSNQITFLTLVILAKTYFHLTFCMQIMTWASQQPTLAAKT